MPTTRPRHVITETENIARALDDAANRWPEDRDNRRQLLLRLIDEGHRAATEQGRQDVARRQAAVAATSGILTGVYGKDYLAELRKDWPA
jgi:hypothetical protein